jgi:hypothetical protein
MEMDKDQKLNDLFAQARTESPQVSFEEMKASFSMQVKATSVKNPITETSNLFTIKTWTIMITSIITTGITIAYLSGFFNPINEMLVQKEQKALIPTMELNSKEMGRLEFNDSEFELNTIENIEVYQPEFSQQELVEKVSIPEELNSDELDIDEALFTDTTKTKEEYRFPILTEEEKKEYAKQKSIMIKQLIKRDKKMYAYIPSGTWVNQGDTISIRPFHMQNTEVTNYQYRTFLFDLLEQGRKAEFMEAKPDQSLWAEDYPDYNQPMVEMYFSHPAYNDYPVNNINRAGAELFCTWITVEANMVLEKKNKPLLNDVRLPSNLEWEYAANGGDSKSAYPWGGQYCKNANGCYLANFNPEGENPDQDGAMHTAKVYSYLANEYGLWCMSGNIAEMVYYNGDKSKPGTKGGSFLSTMEEIQINGPDKFKGITLPNVNIGFRVVISYGIVDIADIKNMR